MRRACFRRALDMPSFPRDVLLRRALRDRDPAIRRLACRAAAGLPDTEFRELWPLLRADPCGLQRVEMLRSALARGMRVDLVEFLCDVDARVRAAAQERWMEEAGDPANRYRELLAVGRGRALAGAILGFAEVAPVAEADVVRPFLHDDLPIVRRAALRALVGLKAPDAVPLCLQAFGDPRPSVTHVARDLMIATFGAATLREVDVPESMRKDIDAVLGRRAIR